MPDLSRAKQEIYFCLNSVLFSGVFVAAVFLGTEELIVEYLGDALELVVILDGGKDLVAVLVELGLKDDL